MEKPTIALHTPYQRRDAYDALSMPVYHCAAYEFDNADIMADAFCGRIDAPDYSRVMNPTVTYFENKVKALTGASDVIAFTSAIPFTEFDAHRLGVDIEVVSSTKYISGGATSLGGLIIDYGSAPGFSTRIRKELLLNLGAYMTPHVAYMQTLGLETLDVRYQRQASNALELAKKLRSIPAIKKVNYIGLEDNPYHELARRQFGPTAGVMLTIDLADKDSCYRFINRLRLIHRATNLFDNKSLAIHPASTIFGPLSQEQRDSIDILDTTIRLSIGLEAVDDLFNDIAQALK